MTVKIQFRRGTAAEWTAANPTLSAGETGFETDTGATKIGTGVATWTSLPYAGGADASTTGKGIVQLAGDLAGTAAAPTIGAGKVVPSKLGGAVDGSVPSKGAGTDTWTWVAPGAVVPDADATTKGKVQLTGDLGGTAASPTVPGLTSKVQLGGDLGGGTISAPQVTATHLAAPLPEAQGGTNAATLAAALSGSGALVTATGSTTARSLAARFKDVVNVKDWGAMGDDATDDTAAIQACLTAAATFPGRIVFFPAGRYLISSVVSIPGSVTLLGAAPQRTGGVTYFARTAGTATSCAMFTLAASASILNATFFFPAGVVSGAAITVTGAASNVENIRMNAAFGGLLVTAPNGVGISNLHASGLNFTSFVNGGYGIRLETSGTGLVNDSDFSDVVIDQASTGANGVQLYGRIESFKLQNGTINRTATGLHLDGSAYGTNTIPDFTMLTNVIMDTSSGPQINIVKASHVRLVNVYATNSESYGVQVGESDDVLIQGGIIANNGTYGIYVTAASKRLRVIGSGIARNQQTGIDIAAGATDFVIQGNTVGTNATPNIGTRTQVTGINVRVGASDRYIIADNLVSGNGTAGVVDGGTGVNKRVANNY